MDTTCKPGEEKNIVSYQYGLAPACTPSFFISYTVMFVCSHIYINICALVIYHTYLVALLPLVLPNVTFNTVVILSQRVPAVACAIVSRRSTFDRVAVGLTVDACALLRGSGGFRVLARLTREAAVGAPSRLVLASYTFSA